MPCINRGIIEEYILYRQVLDRELNKDTNAMKNGEKMAEEGILATSIYVEEIEEDAATAHARVFFTGMVAAEMKNVS